MSAGPGLEFSGCRALITGGLGFIGSNLARRLAGLGAQVTVVDNLAPGFGGNPYNLHGMETQVRIVPADLRDRARVEPLLPGQDCLFDLAAQVSHAGGMEDPLTDLEANASARVSLLEMVRKANPSLRIVYAGTRQVYGRPQRLPVDEDHPLEPVDYNAVSKLAGEWYHRAGRSAYGLRCTILRMTNVYGPRMRIRDGRKTFIGLWFRQLLEGQPITVYGDGRQMRDLNYVEDAVEALLAAAGPQAEGQVYNLGGPPVALIDLARQMIEVHGSGSLRLVPFPAERARIEIGDYYADSSRIRSQLGWTPATPLREGIARTLDYYRDHRRFYLDEHPLP